MPTLHRKLTASAEKRRPLFGLSRPSFRKPDHLEKKGANISRPRDQETTNR